MNKSCSILFGTHYKLSTPTSDFRIQFKDGSYVRNVDSIKYLGLWLDPELSFKPHIDYIIKRTYSTLNPIFRSANCLTEKVRNRIITQLILPIVDNADIIYQNTYDQYLKPLNTLFNSLCRFILKCPYRTPHCILFEKLNWLQPFNRRQYHWILFIYKCIYFDFLQYLRQLLIPATSSYSLRSTQCLSFTAPHIYKEVGRRAFQYKAPSEWNRLPTSIRSVTSFPIFKSSVFAYLKTPCSCL